MKKIPKSKNKIVYIFGETELQVLLEGPEVPGVSLNLSGRRRSSWERRTMLMFRSRQPWRNWSPTASFSLFFLLVRNNVGCRLTDQLQLSNPGNDDFHQQLQLPVHRVPGHPFLHTDGGLRWGDSLDVSWGRFSWWDLQWSLVQRRRHIVTGDIWSFLPFYQIQLELRVRMAQPRWEVPVQLCWWTEGSWWRTGSSACPDCASWRSTTPPAPSCLSSVGSSGNVLPDTTRIRYN